MDRWKAEQGRGREKKKIRREKSRRERVRRKKMQMREKVGKSRDSVFPMICGSEGSKSRLAKAAGAEPAGQTRDEKLHAVVREAHFEVKMYKTHHCRTTFGVEMSKKCTSLWREAHFQVNMYKNTPGSDHFWKLRCRKSARRCGAKHISKSKCARHRMFAPLLQVQMSKKCTPLWREADFEVKMYKTHHCRTTFGVEMSKKCTSLWREAHFQVNMYKNTPGSDHFWRFRCRFASLHYINYTTLHSTTLQYTTLHYTTLQLQLHNYTPLHSTN